MKQLLNRLRVWLIAKLDRDGLTAVEKETAARADRWRR
jgi:hypothetical protein